MDLNKFLNQPDVIEALKRNNLDYVYKSIEQTYGDNYFQAGGAISDIFRDVGIDYLKYVRHLDQGMLHTYDDINFDYSKYTNITEISNYGFEDIYFGDNEDVILPKSIQIIGSCSFAGSTVRSLRVYTDNLKLVDDQALNIESGRVVIDDQIEFKPYPGTSNLTTTVANYFKKKHIIYY